MSAVGHTEVFNGVPIYFELYGTGEPLVMLHGFGGCSQDWSALMPRWSAHFQLVVPDMRGHGRSGILTKPFRHDDAADDIAALLNHLGIHTFKGLGVSGGGNVLLHLATRQPERMKAMALVSATSYFPAQARPIMRDHAENLSQQEWETMRRRHPGGDAQIKALLASTKGFAESFDDMNFSPQSLATIRARTLIVQGDLDPLYPIEISEEMARAIPQARLWVIPGGGHGPIGGERWPEFVKTAFSFLSE